MPADGGSPASELVSFLLFTLGSFGSAGLGTAAALRLGWRLRDLALTGLGLLLCTYTSFRSELGREGGVVG